MENKHWSLNNLHGSLSHEGCSIAVEFDVSCDAHGELSFAFARVPLTSDVRKLEKVWHQKGRYGQHFCLEGHHDDGSRVSTDCFYISGWNSTHVVAAGESSVGLQGDTSRLDVTRPFAASIDSPVAVYGVVGLEGFQPLTTAVPEGLLEIGGTLRPQDYSEVTGFVRLTKGESDDLNRWVAACDTRVSLVLDVLSLALDCQLWWTMRRVFDPDSSTQRFRFRGAAPEPSRPHHPILSDLHLQPAIDLIHTYTEELRDEVGMGTALALFLMRPTYVEPRFITAMAGLDHLLQRFAGCQPSGALVDKQFYKTSILPRLEQALRESLDGVDEEIPDEVAQAFAGKLKGLNRKTMRSNLWEFLDHYQVPTAGIAEDQINHLIRVRNDLFHGREFSPRADGECLNDNVAVLHELMRRIFLTLLGYKGSRWTFLHGPEWVTFPPAD